MAAGRAVWAKENFAHLRYSGSTGDPRMMPLSTISVCPHSGGASEVGVAPPSTPLFLFLLPFILHFPIFFFFPSFFFSYHLLL